VASWCITFHPHPDVIMRPHQKHTYLVELDEKVDLIRAQGIDEVKVFEFTRKLSALSPAAFIELIQSEHPLSELWIGPDFAMGQGRAGTADSLRQIGRDQGFGLQIMPPFTYDGAIVSSTRIRQLLSAGDVASAARLLGRPYALKGSVESGAGRGTPIGFPTANVRPPAGMSAPADGVYVIRVQHEGRRWDGVANLGGRPTFNEQERIIEAHLLDFTGNLRGETIIIEFLKRLRSVQAFPSLEALVSQIHADVESARTWFAARASTH